MKNITLLKTNMATRSLFFFVERLEKGTQFTRTMKQRQDKGTQVERNEESVSRSWRSLKIKESLLAEKLQRKPEKSGRLRSAHTRSEVPS